MPDGHGVIVRYNYADDGSVVYDINGFRIMHGWTHSDRGLAGQKLAPVCLVSPSLLPYFHLIFLHLIRMSLYF